MSDAVTEDAKPKALRNAAVGVTRAGKCDRGRDAVRWAGVLLLLVCLALPAPRAAAQERTPTPSAKELWKAYPLDPSPSPSAAPAAASSRAGSGAGRPPEGASARSDGGAPIVLLALVVLVVVAGVVALGGLVLRRRGHSRLAAGPTAGDRNGSREVDVQSPNGDARPGALVPPALDRAWVAALEWRHADAEARFCAVARRDDGEPGTVLADSGPLEWPPAGPASVQALTDAAETLERALLAGGWKSLPRGPEWYAKRFAWEPKVDQSQDSPQKPTRAGLFRLAAAGSAVVAGGAVIGGRDDGGFLAAPSADTDARILNYFLLLEYVQEALYREALRSAGLTAELEALARAVGAQESEHVAFLTERLAGRARARPQTDFGDALSTPERFRATAIDLEETAIGAYIGQSANLTRGSVRAVGTLLSVEARQAAWLLDLAGDSPAPRAADAARKPDEVLAHLRGQGFIA
jgi:Ferritin-like domain